MTIGNEAQKTIENLNTWLMSKGLAPAKSISKNMAAFKEYLTAVGGDYSKFEKLSDTEKQAYLNEIQANYDAQFVTLATGEKVKKTDYDKLSAEEQKTLSALGVKEYNAQNETKRVASLQEYLTAVGGDFAAYEALPDTDKQAYLDKLQSDYVARQAAAQAQFEANNVKLNDGTYLARSNYDALSNEDRAFVMANGVVALNQKLQTSYTTQQAAVIAQFEQANVK